VAGGTSRPGRKRKRKEKKAVKHFLRKREGGSPEKNTNNAEEEKREKDGGAFTAFGGGENLTPTKGPTDAQRPTGERGKSLPLGKKGKQSTRPPAYPEGKKKEIFLKEKEGPRRL